MYNCCMLSSVFVYGEDLCVNVDSITTNGAIKFL